MRTVPCAHYFKSEDSRESSGRIKGELREEGGAQERRDQEGTRALELEHLCG